MKIEKRGKFAGVKVHLDPEEAKVFVELHTRMCDATGPITYTPATALAAKIGKATRKIMAQEPDVFVEKTEDQVREALIKEIGKLTEKLGKLDVELTAQREVA